mgnify:CR=1 FL=1
MFFRNTSANSRNKVIRKPGKQEKDVFLEHFRQVQQPPVCEKSIRRQGKKRGDGDQGDEEMEKKSVSKLISSSPHSPYPPFFIRDMTDCRRLKCYEFLALCGVSSVKERQCHVGRATNLTG